MRKYLYLGTGAAVGAVLRYILETGIGGFSGFHWNTFLVNTAGCFLIAFFLPLAMINVRISSNMRIGIAIGLIGAFTTFSTVCEELGKSIVNGFFVQALVYAAATLISGFAAIYLGMSASRWLINKKTSGGRHR